jgi:hypothetical protein
MTSEAIVSSRSTRMQVRPKVSRDSLAASMALQTATLRYKRGPGQECICHDGVYAVSRSKTSRLKGLGGVKVGQPGTVEQGARQMKPVTHRKRR